MSTYLTSFLVILSMTFTPQVNENLIDNFNKETRKLTINDPETAILRLDSAIEMSQSIDYLYGEVYALYLKGYTYRKNGSSGKSFVTYLNALDLVNNESDSKSIDIVLTLHREIGYILRSHYKYDDAIKYYEEALELTDKFNLEEIQLELLYDIGYSQRHNEDLNEAILTLQKAHSLAVKLKNESKIINVLNLIGLTYRDKEEFDKSRDYFNQILNFQFNKLSKEKYLGRAYHNIGTSYVLAEDLEMAEAYYLKALIEKQQYKNTKDLFITQMDLADIYHQTGRADEAHELAVSSIAKYDKLSLSPDYYKVFDLLKNIAATRNDLAGVVTYSDRYFEENNKFLTQQTELIKIRDQFKMEMLSASYFTNLERDKMISSLYTYILYGLLSLAAAMVLRKAWNMWRKKQLEKDLQQAFSEFNDIDKLL